MVNSTDNEKQPVLRGDRPYTLILTAVCLAIGLIVAVPLGMWLYRMSQPLAVQGGQVSWTFNAFAFPLALLVSGVILAGSVFILPLTIARRMRRVLDPLLWPQIGVYALTVILAGGFVLAIVFGLI